MASSSSELIGLRSLLEAVRDFFDTVVEDVGKTQQDRSTYVAHLQLVHHLFEVDGGISAAGGDDNMSFFID